MSVPYVLALRQLLEFTLVGDRSVLFRITLALHRLRDVADFRALSLLSEILFLLYYICSRDVFYHPS